MDRHHPEVKKGVDRAKKLMDQDIITSSSDPIQREKWPKEYKKKHKINNLWRYELPEYYRLIFTVVTKGHQKIYRIFDVPSHPEYNRLFGYD